MSQIQTATRLWGSGQNNVFQACDIASFLWTDLLLYLLIQVASSSSLLGTVGSATEAWPVNRWRRPTSFLSTMRLNTSAVRRGKLWGPKYENASLMAPGRTAMLKAAAVSSTWCLGEELCVVVLKVGGGCVWNFLVVMETVLAWAKSTRPWGTMGGKNS